MKKWFRMKTCLELFRSIARKGALFFYQLGLILIAGWTLASLIMAYHDVLTNPIQLLTVTEFANLENGWFVALMMNIITSDANRIIGRGLIVLIIWILLFLFVPLATRSLKSFRLFQFEIELEDEDPLEEGPVEISQYARLKIISNIYSENHKMSLYRFYNEHTGRADYSEALAYYLEMLSGEYIEQVGIQINWGLYDWQSLPDEWRQQAYISADKDKPCIKNKYTTSHGVSKNHMIYTYQHHEIVLVTVLWSYHHEFDAIDQQCIYILHQALSDRLKNIEYTFWIKQRAAGGQIYELDCDIMER